MGHDMEGVGMVEDILDPDLPIIDAHHHLWRVDPVALAHWQTSDNPYAHVRRTVPLYLTEQLGADLADGHNVVATVYAECGSMYRADGPPELRSVGEVEFANGVAAIFASGQMGSSHACAGIVGHADLSLGSGVVAVLEMSAAAAGGRLKSIRHVAAYDPDIPIFANQPSRLFYEPGFRDGLRALQRMGLRFDAWMLEPQLDDLVALAAAMPGLPIVLNHCGTPLGIGPYAGQLTERFDRWRSVMRRLAECPNMSVKLGGLGMPICGFPSFRQTPPAHSRQLAAEWSPYIESCIDFFGADRCMFESNFPTESGSCTYRVLWNAFKRIASSASPDEKFALFHDSAARFYDLRLPRTGTAA